MESVKCSVIRYVLQKLIVGGRLTLPTRTMSSTMNDSQLGNDADVNTAPIAEA
jgi:hypothetical protein